MDENGNSLDTIQTVESINSQITDLRQAQPPNEYKAGTIEQSQFQEKKKALYAQRRELTNKAQSDEAQSGGRTIDQINERIESIRNNPIYNDSLRNGTVEKNQLHTEMTELYQQRQSLKGDQAPPVSLSPDNPGSLIEQARQELEQLQALGLDISNEDIENDMTQDKVDAYRRVVQIESGDFENLSSPMSKAARMAGYSTPEVLAPKGFLATKFEGTNDLKKKILRLISEDIYNSKGA